MAIYSYHCDWCKKSFELNVPMEERDEQECEECGTEAERRLVFTGAVYSPTSTGGGLKR